MQNYQEGIPNQSLETTKTCKTPSKTQLAATSPTHYKDMQKDIQSDHEMPTKSKNHHQETQKRKNTRKC